MKFTHNAKCDTAETLPTFRDPFKHRRCIVPADRFYEWHKPDEKKKGIPHWVSLPNRDLFTFAGLWNEWNKYGAAPLYTFTIITQPAEEQIAWLHHRRPLIFAPYEEELWLSEMTDLAQVRDLVNHVPNMKLSFTASDPHAEAPIGGLFT